MVSWSISINGNRECRMGSYDWRVLRGNHKQGKAMKFGVLAVGYVFATRAVLCPRAES